jgi:hypothetical protein
VDLGDATTLGFSLGALLLIAVVGSLPAFLRVFRMRRAERLLGWAYWPLLHALDERDRQHEERPRDG